MILESVAKFKKNPTCALENAIRNLANFCHTKVAKLGLLLGPFIQSRKCMSLKFKWGVMCYDNGEWTDLRRTDLSVQS